MVVEVGSRVGHYDVTALIGEGGMGQVYQATDTKLNRQVALKILPEEFAADPDRLARFQREAQVLASLNHPNIGQIHGIEDSEGTKALILEMVEGPTLADRITQGPIPVDEALPIAKQIAEALEAAHEQGVIHRDLKPANIKLKPDGTVKVLDFGLAKALDTTPEDDPNQSPTLTAAATQLGVIMGTAAYMSPEQAKGQQVDRQTDIWAFGATLFEMLTGSRVFGEGTLSEILARVIERPVDLESLPPGAPTAVTRLLGRCLARERRRRLSDIADARLELEDVIEGMSSERPSQPESKSAIRSSTLPLALGALTIAVVALITSAERWLSIDTPGGSPPPTQFSIVLPRSHLTQFGAYQSVAIAPSGRFVILLGERALHLRSMDANQLVMLRETEDIDALGAMISPDDEWVAFYSVQSNQLLKLRLPDGPVVPITDIDSYFGGTWNADGRIIFAQGPQGIFAVTDDGGTPELLLPVDAEAGEVARNPQLLPGGEWILFTLVGSPQPGRPVSRVVVQSLTSGERRVVVEEGTDARYLPTGHIVYGSDAADGSPTRSLLAAPFGLEQLALLAAPTPVVDGVARQTVNGAPDFDVSLNGSLVYRPVSGLPQELVWVDRDGEESPLGAPARSYVYVRVSPTGGRVAASLSDQENDIWIWDIERQSLGRLTFGASRELYVVWTPDERFVMFGSDRDGGSSLYARAADGTGSAERLVEPSPNILNPNSISPDGSRLVVREITRGRRNDLMLLHLDERRTERLLSGPHNELNGEISPDGRWLAYQSDESGEPEIYMRPFPSVDEGQWQVSSGGGMQPLWGPDGSELYYVTAESHLMRVSVESATAPRLGSPEVVIRLPRDAPPFPLSGRTYDISPDGQRFLVLRQAGGVDDPLADIPRYDVVLGWFEELTERVSVP